MMQDVDNLRRINHLRFITENLRKSVDTIQEARVKVALEWCRVPEVKKGGMDAYLLIQSKMSNAERYVFHMGLVELERALSVYDLRSLPRLMLDSAITNIFENGR
jgi:hypothetical protein